MKSGVIVSNVLKHKDMIDALFSRYGLLTSCYEIISDVQMWCEKQGVEESNPFRAAKCCCGGKDGMCQIVFRAVQTDDMSASAKGAMEQRGFGAEVKKLDSDAKYLEHLILHEIACKIFGTTEQG